MKICEPLINIAAIREVNATKAIHGIASLLVFFLFDYFYLFNQKEKFHHGGLLRCSDFLYIDLLFRSLKRKKYNIL